MNLALRDSFYIIKQHGPAYLLAAAIFVLSWQLIWGDHGLMEYRSLQNEKRDAISELETVTSERMALELRVKHLRPESLDLDLLEEQARTMLGFSHPDERVVILR